MNYKPITTFIFIILLFGSLSAQTYSETRSYIKTLPVNRETSLDINNKYGTIEITNWDKDSVYIRAEVKVFATNHSRLRKLFDGVNINITDTKYLVRAQTDFNQNISMLFESFKGMTRKLIPYESRIEINYFINIPEYINLNIDNKYGSVYMENNTGNFSISISNGSFKANSIGNGSSITLAFCDAKINSIISGKIDASFSETFIIDAGEISIKGISSKFDIKKIKKIQVESRRDKFYIDNIEILKGNSYFTDFKINTLIKELDIETRYGNVNIYQIDKDFEAVNINSNYSDLSLVFEQGSSYNLDIRQINTFVVLPEKNSRTEEKALNEDKKEYITFGTVGKNPGTTKVKIDATRGHIFLK
jgi:hypothetical protein